MPIHHSTFEVDGSSVVANVCLAPVRADAAGGKFLQPTHLQSAVQYFPNVRQSQYFFKHLQMIKESKLKLEKKIHATYFVWKE